MATTTATTISIAAMADRYHVVDGVDLKKKQKAIVTPELRSILDLRLVETTIEPPKSDEVVVKIECTGICGSDVMFSLGPSDGLRGPNHIAGHEGIGRIVASHDPSMLGKPVAARFVATYCRSCRACLADIPECCPDQTNYPRHHKGTFQQYMTAPLASLMPLSESIMNDKPAMYTSALCSGSAALRALQKLSPRADDVVVVSGVCGSIGHMAGLMAKSIYHAKVIGVDTEGKAVSLGERMADVMDAFVAALHDESGAEVFERAIRQACVRLRGDAAGDYGADSSVIASSEPGGFSRMTYYIKDGGSIMLLGVPKKPDHAINIPSRELVERSIRVEGSLMGGWDTSYQVMEYIRQGRIRPILNEVGLADVPRVMASLKSCQSVGKTVVMLDG